MTDLEGIPAINGDFTGKSFVSVDQLTLEDVAIVMRESAAMEEAAISHGRIDLLADMVVGELFYEPSTRTYLSFAAAAVRLGTGMISERGVSYSSIAKGEILEDTVRTVERYADVVVMRHPDIGSAARAARAMRKPLLNAGDGAGEHPTQALLDVRTMQKYSNVPLSESKVAFIGDNKFGRTSKSASKLLGMFGTEVWFVSPEELAIPDEIVRKVKDNGGSIQKTTHLEEALEAVDVAYMMRIQKERFPSENDYEKVKNLYVLDEKMLARMQPHAKIMHPLPRVNELPLSVDNDPRAIYFDQVEEGMYVRMALLALVCGRTAIGNKYSPIGNRHERQ